MQTAASELETRLGEIEAQDERLQSLLGRTRHLLEALREQACIGPMPSTALISLVPGVRTEAAAQPLRAQA